MTDWSSACVIRLTEENRAGDGMCVFKYQAAPDVLREAMEIYGTAPGEGGTRILKQRVRVTGVFSPVGRCMKTAFSMALGQRLAEKKPTVLLNFEACPGFDEIMHTEYGQTLSDALYYIRADEPRAPERILPMLQKIGRRQDRRRSAVWTTCRPHPPLRNSARFRGRTGISSSACL